MVVYAILKGNVKKLKSNLKYIQLFRHETRLESQEEYYFTTINSALEFIENSNYNKLNIREIDFNAYCDEYDKIELERMKTPLLVFKRNPDENHLLYQLTNGRKMNLDDSNNYIELSNFNQNISINTESVISKSLMNTNAFGLLQVDLEKLYREYFNNTEFNEFTIFKIEKLFNDFRIIVKLIEYFKNSYNNEKKLSTANDKVSTSDTKLIDI